MRCARIICALQSVTVLLDGFLNIARVIVIHKGDCTGNQPKREGPKSWDICSPERRFNAWSPNTAVEVIEHRHMQIERCCYQHGNVTTFEHSVRVACLAVWMADRAHLWYRVDLKSPDSRGPPARLLPVYDWHDWDNGEHQWHGFTHGHAAPLVNALKGLQAQRYRTQQHREPSCSR